MGVYRKLKSDGSWDWYIDYRFQGRRLRERIGPNKAQARTVLQKRRVEMAEGKFLEKRRESKTTLAEMAKLYLDNHAKPAKRSWKDDKRLLDGFVEYFGDIRLSEITPLTLENYRRDKKTPDKKGKKLADATLNRHMAALKTMFSKAVEWGKAASNPVKTIKLYHENNALEGRIAEEPGIPPLEPGSGPPPRPRPLDGRRRPP
ncbi:MAG: phage integrase SAM-like domain-containing protein [Acidobacteria bacterium]|nr:phage integrase SAM-like domain-containing protein [Acidobacteriota bacterium]